MLLNSIWKNLNTIVNKLYAFKYIGHTVLFSFYLVVVYAYLYILFCFNSSSLYIKTLIDM